jgi:hypothetical protein
MWNWLKSIVSAKKAAGVSAGGADRFATRGFLVELAALKGWSISIL